jgi:hypothetical protein
MGVHLWFQIYRKHKVEAPIKDRGPIADFIFKGHTFLRHVSMNTIDNCLKLKLSKIGSSTLDDVGFGYWLAIGQLASELRLERALIVVN